MRSRVLPAILLLACWPTAAAAPEDASPTPCIGVDLSTDPDEPDLRTVPEGCGEPTANVALEDLTVGAGEIAGGIRVTLFLPLGAPSLPDAPGGLLETWFTAESSDVAPVVPSPLVHALMRVTDAATSWARDSAQQLPLEPDEAPSGASSDWVVISIRFHARWSAARCDGAEGEAAATAGGATFPVAAPRAFFAALCALAQEARDDRALAGIAGFALAQLGDAWPALAPSLDPVVRALQEGVWTAGETVLQAAPSAGEAGLSQSASAGGPGVGADEQLSAGLALLPRDEATRRERDEAKRHLSPADLDLARPERSAPRPRAPGPSAPPQDPMAGDPPARGLAPPAERGAARLHSGRAQGEPAAALAGLGGAAVALLALLGAALYQRFSTPRALEHPVREALHRACVAAPDGATATDLALAVGVGRKAAEYHLVYLARAGLLSEVREAGRRRFVSPAVAKPSEPRACLSARVLQCVQGRPGITAAQLAEALGVARMRADRHVKELLYLGRIESRIGEGGRQLYPRASR